MGRGVKAACIIMGILFLSQGIFCQEIQNRTIPSALLRPERGEAPRYPNDLVIGEMGQGDASATAYQFAKELLSALVSGSDDAPLSTIPASRLTESLLEQINNLEPQSYRLGSGRKEIDGDISFLVRFIGAEESITGELFIMKEETEETDGEEKWTLDELILEEKRALSEIRDSYRYDFSPYERFF